MTSLADVATVVAIALGALALGIAVWDHIRDGYFWARRAGPLEVKLVTFDLPQPEVRVHPYVVAGQTREFKGTEIRLVFHLRNRVSWPVYFSTSLTIREEGNPDHAPLVLNWLTRDELLQETGPSLFVPPRQPVTRTAWIVLAEGREAELSPAWMAGGRRWVSREERPKRIRWIEGKPVLND